MRTTVDRPGVDNSQLSLRIGEPRDAHCLLVIDLAHVRYTAAAL